MPPRIDAPGPEILSIEAMGEADAFAVAAGVPAERLMETAGTRAAAAIRARYAPRPTLVLCGPGDNGGDGFVVARRLAEAGFPVRLAALEPDGGGSPARRAARDAAPPAAPLSEIVLADAVPAGGLVVDALFGAGLSRPLEGDAARLAREAAAADVVVAALDVPSGVHGDRAVADGPAFRADLTVTFHRLKPAHVLEPGRSACGEVVCVDIGVPEGWARAAGAETAARLNGPDLWRAPGLVLEAQIHKHRRGRLGVLSGPAGATGAARLAAMAGLRAGAGLVTLLLPGSGLQEAAAASLAVMTRKLDPDAGFADALDAIRAEAAVMGPGAGVGALTAERVLAAAERGGGLVLDADALTSFEDAPERLFAVLHERCVLTPHAGEFSRLFGDPLERAENRIEAAREAAREAGAVVLLKGPDTVIAAPDGRARVNVHASPRLATAGTGDVLAGLVGGFLAQGADAFDAASAAAWIHGEAGLRLGPGETAEDLLARLPDALSALAARAARTAALSRLLRE